MMAISFLVMSGATMAMSAQPYSDPCYQRLKTIPNCFNSVLTYFCYLKERNVSDACCKIYKSLDYDKCILKFADEAAARDACVVYDNYIDFQADQLLRECNSRI